MKESTAKKLIKMTNELYEKEAESFNETRNQLWEKEILEFLAKIKPGSSILDLGCGNGRLLSQILYRRSTQIKSKTSPKHSNILQNIRMSYLGMDRSRALIRQNQKKYGKQFFRIGDGLKFPHRADPLYAEKFKNKFDYIISIAVLHHIPSEKLQLIFLKNIYNGLKTNGQALITVWNRWQDRYQKYFKQNKPFADMEYTDIMVPWKQSGFYRYVHVFKPDELKNLVKKAGFKNIKVFASKHGKIVNLKEALNIYLIGKKCEIR